MVKKIIQGVVDRIEENIAVIELEDGQALIEIPKKYLPEQTKDGSVLKISIELDFEKEKKLREEVENLQDELLNNT